MTSVECRELKYTSKQHFEKIKALKECDLIPHELGDLCVLYLGYRELVVKTKIDVLGEITLSHTPLYFKKVKLVDSDFRCYDNDHEHEHTFHIDKESNQQTMNCLKHLQRMITRKIAFELPFEIERINLVLKHTLMQETNFLVRDKSFLSFYPLKTAPYYEVKFKCRCTGCKQICTKNNSDEFKCRCTGCKQIRTKKNSDEKHQENSMSSDTKILYFMECDIFVMLHVRTLLTYSHNSLQFYYKRIIGETTSIVFKSDCTLKPE
jgi:hypothetical protein